MRFIEAVNEAIDDFTEEADGIEELLRNPDRREKLTNERQEMLAVRLDRLRDIIRGLEK